MIALDLNVSDYLLNMYIIRREEERVELVCNF